MNNAAYGKTMENLGNRVHVRLVKQQKRLISLDIKMKLCSAKCI